MERKTIRVSKNAARSGHRFRMANMVSIICPNCGFRRLIDSGMFTVSETFIPGQNGYESADYYQKCSRCNEEIGIKKLK